jgi:hypothetical protein
MDYIDDINEQIQREYEIVDDMERLGIDDYDEYLNYMADLEADAQEAHLEAIQMEDTWLDTL